MNTNRIVLAILAVSLVATQPIVAADQKSSDTSTSNIIDHAKKEYQTFRGAVKCARKQGFTKCSRSQKKRIIIAGVVLAAVIAGAVGIPLVRKMTTQSPSNKLAELIQRKDPHHASFRLEQSKREKKTFEGDPEIATLLRSGANPNMKNEKGNPLLNQAIESDLYSYAITLIKHGALNVANPEGKTAQTLMRDKWDNEIKDIKNQDNYQLVGWRALKEIMEKRGLQIQRDN